ncbi:hypothetical protein C1H46_020559 [Malus baccata]|uniref:Uncharacterized protein n=1 Tax=Malus baccata TaxID=106549 RepID=A0A540M566_MALBA|nr:hypothetical protein C1H46_020559 [Malus baccata]
MAENHSTTTPRPALPLLLISNSLTSLSLSLSRLTLGKFPQFFWRLIRVSGRSQAILRPRLGLLRIYYCSLLFDLHFDINCVYFGGDFSVERSRNCVYFGGDFSVAAVQPATQTRSTRPAYQRTDPNSNPTRIRPGSISESGLEYS